VTSVVSATAAVTAVGYLLAARRRRHVSTARLAKCGIGNGAVAVAPRRSWSPLPSPSAPATGIGIAGVTTVVACPLARAEQPCPPQPVSARSFVLDATTGTTVASVTSGVDGRFNVPIKLGRYRLVPLRLAGGPPHPQAQTVVTATAAGYTGVVLRFYTGIV
jgi:hypothetical protein